MSEKMLESDSENETRRQHKLNWSTPDLHIPCTVPTQDFTFSILLLKLAAILFFYYKEFAEIPKLPKVRETDYYEIVPYQLCKLN